VAVEPSSPEEPVAATGVQGSVATDDASVPAPTAAPADTWPRALAIAETCVLVAIVAACAIYVFVQQRPDLLLRNTTTNGGDMGAHVWWPAYLRDHLLPNWRVAGWAPDWYAGFPVGQYYFPLPALAIVGLDVVLPYNIAFKLVTAAGPIMLPIAAYAFARCLRAPRIAAPLCSLATVVLLFFKGDPRQHTDSKTAAFDQHIMGGTLASNLAGEFSFTIALALALFAMAALARALQRRRGLGLPAVLLAAALLSHLVVGIFAGVGAVLVWLAYRPLKNLKITLAIGAVAAALTAFWTIPLVATFGYTTNMNYEKIEKFGLFMFPRYFWWEFALALIAVIVGFVEVRRATLVTLAFTLVFGLVFCYWPQSAAWNLRFLPFWYLGIFLLAGFGAAEIVLVLASLFSRFTVVDPVAFDPQPASVPMVSVGADETDGTDEHERAPQASELLPARPPVSEEVVERRGLVSRALALGLVACIAVVTLVLVNMNRGFLPFWAQWNYSGYEQSTGRAGKASAEFKELIHTMNELPPGRATWEGGSAIDRYGTPLALELLPYFTHGRIDSMEGLYFESSATTPYHFVAVSALSGTGNASNPVRGLQYKTLADFRQGVQYLRTLGVRYYMAYSNEAKQAADNDPSELRLVARVPDLDNQAPQGWNVYEVRNSPLVEGLRYPPVVATGMKSGTSATCYGTAPQQGVTQVRLDPWECLAAGWFDKTGNLARPLAASGPGSWKRAPAALADLAPTGSPLPEVTVTKTRSTNNDISFHVSRTGVPVVVKTSYFPNWRASGAKGPWRLTPNLMVVVPTSHDVKLHYTRTGAEWLGIVVTAIGLAGLVALWRWRPAPLPPRRNRPDPDDDGPATASGEPDAVRDPDDSPHEPALA
jgi:hypothetical protein